MIITVGGSIGSGKTTLARRLARYYGLKYYSVGHAMRELAKEKGLSLMELSRLAERDHSIDRELDRKQIELSHDDVVVDSRLGAHMLDADFRIWLEVSIDVAAQRTAGRDNIPIKKAKERIKERRASEVKRYREIYGIDLNDKSAYDLVIDTDNLTADQVFQRCVEALNPIIKPPQSRH